MTYKLEDISDQIFGYLTAIKPLRSAGRRGTYWLFRCICGKLSERIGCEVKAGVCKLCCSECTIASIRDKFIDHGLTTRMFLNQKHSALRRNISFSLEKQDIINIFLKQNKKCFYTRIRRKFWEYCFFRKIKQ